MAKANFKLIFFFLLFNGVELLKAQEGQVLFSLDSCLTIAKSKNFLIREAEINIKLSEEKIKEAHKTWIPKISGFYNGFYDIYRANHIDEVIEDDHPHTKHLHYDLSNVAGIEASVLLYNFNSRKYRKEKSLFENLVAINEKKDQENKVILRIYELFFTILINQKLLNISENNVNNLSDLHKISEKKFAIGVITKFDLSQIEQEYNNSVYDHQEKEQQLTQSKFALLNFLQLEHSPDNLVIQDFESSQNDSTLSKLLLFKFNKEHLENYPILLAEKNRLKIMEKEVLLYKNNIKPKINGFMSFGTSSQSFLNAESQNNSLYSQWGNNINNRIGVSITVPILNNYSDKSIIVQSRILVENQINNIDRIENELYGQIYSELLNLKNDQKLISLAKVRENVSKKVFEMSVSAFNSGTINTYDLNKSRLDFISNQVERARLEITSRLREKVIKVYYQFNI